MTRTLNEIQAMLNGQDFVKQFISDLRGDVNAFGGDDQMTYDAIKSDSQLRREFAKLIVEDSESSRLVSDLKEIKIFEPSFPKEPFFSGKTPLFRKKGLVRFYFWNDGFRERVMEEIPSIIPSLSITLRKDEFVKYARYSRCMKELGNPQPLRVPEFAGVIHNLFLRSQRNIPEVLFEGYYKKKKPISNLFPIMLRDGKLLIINIYRTTDEWSLMIGEVKNNEYHLFTRGSCIFSRCQPDAL